MLQKEDALPLTRSLFSWFISQDTDHTFKTADVQMILILALCLMIDDSPNPQSVLSTAIDALKSYPYEKETST